MLVLKHLGTGVRIPPPPFCVALLSRRQHRAMQNVPHSFGEGGLFSNTLREPATTHNGRPSLGKAEPRRAGIRVCFDWPTKLETVVII